MIYIFYFPKYNLYNLNDLIFVKRQQWIGGS